MSTAISFIWLLWQGEGDIRKVSWWLDRSANALGVNRELFWSVVLTLNFLALVWVLYKALFAGKEWSLPGTLRERGVSIREQLQQAERAQREAQQRMETIEQRIANLPQELEAIAAREREEAEAEYQRLLAEGRAEGALAAHQAAREIEAASKLAQKELKGHAAGLAMELAEKRLRERLTPELDRAVVAAGVEALRARQ